MHKLGICHRDLKPENLLMDDYNNIKIVDFGLSNTYKEGETLKTACGSPCYAAPEMIAGKRYHGLGSDIWSCGIILYALLTGNLPFDDENIRKLLQKVMTGIYHIPEDVSPSPRDLLAKMLQVDPTMRPTLREVMMPPWFNSKAPKNAIKIAPSPFETDAIEEGYPEHYEFENDLIEALNLLGWTDKQALISNLRAKK